MITVNRGLILLFRTVKFKGITFFISFILVQRVLLAGIFPIKSNPIHAISAARIQQEFTLGSRYFFMNTNNTDQVGTDFYANGLNVNLNYQYDNLFDRFPLKVKDSLVKYHRLNFVASYSQISNLNSSDLSLSNRYEIGLFDLQNPSIRNFGNLTLCYLNYENRKYHVDLKVGRMIPSSPFINAQDGRLRPTSIQGAQLAFHKNSKSKNRYFNVDLNLATNILARSTGSWKSINESIGLYPQGVSVFGKPAQYIQKNSTIGNSVFFSTFNFLQFFGKKENEPNLIGAQYHVLYMDKLMFTNMFNLEGAVSVNKDFNIGAAAMWIHQQFLVDSAGTVPEKRYAETNEKSNVYSSKLWFDYKTLNSKHTLNFAMTNISNEGRYLMPREWGKDPFYTFMPRERNEGFGNVHAYTVNYIARGDIRNMPNSFPLKSLSLDLGYGNYSLPDVKNFRLNKYGMPSFQQINAVLGFDFSLKRSSKYFKQHTVNLKLWYIQKINSGDTYNLVKYISNKVDMTQVNIVLNYLITIF